MTVTTEDVVSKDSIARIVEQATQATLGFRRAFRGYPLPSAQGPEISIPTAPKEVFNTDDYVEIPETAEYPRADPEEFGSVSATIAKRGFEVPVSDEAAARGRLQAQLDIAENMAETEQRALDAIAGSLLMSSVATSGAGNDDDVLAWEEIVTARQQLRADDYNPDLLLMEPLGMGDLLKSDRFSNRSVLMSDEAIRNGETPDPIAGMSPYELTTPGIDAHSAVLVDTSKFAYEVTEPIGGDGEGDVSTHRNEENDETVYKTRSFKGWTITDANAATIVNG